MITFVAIGFLILHLVAGYATPAIGWGVHFPAYLPAWASVVVILSAMSFAVPAGRRLLGRLFNRLEMWCRPLTLVTGNAALLVAGMAVFIASSSAVHLLGDGYLYLRELPLQTIRADHSPASFWTVRVMYEVVRSSLDAERVYRLYSYSAGLLYLLVAVSTAKILSRDRRVRALSLVVLVTPGYMLVFCGYVETYALPYAGTVLYLYAGLATIRGKLPWWGLSVLLGALIPLHFILATLIPSLLLVVAMSPRYRRSPGANEGGDEEGPTRRLFSPLRTLASPAIVACGTLLVLTAVNVDPRMYSDVARGSNLLPLTGPGSHYQAYSMFAPRHLVDFVNQLLLAAPIAVLALIALRRRMWSTEPESLFLSCAALVPLAATFVMNPEIGAFRDWDLLAFPAIPLVLWSASRLGNAVEKGSLRREQALIMAGVAGLHTLLWLALNASAVTSTERFVDLLDRGSLSTHARSYGWDTMGEYYRAKGDIQEELEASEIALAANPQNPRHWFNVGVAYSRMGDRDRAIDSWKQAVRLNPEFLDAYDRLATALFEAGDTEEANNLLRKILTLNPEPDHEARIREWLPAFSGASPKSSVR